MAGTTNIRISDPVYDRLSDDHKRPGESWSACLDRLADESEEDGLTEEDVRRVINEELDELLREVRDAAVRRPD